MMIFQHMSALILFISILFLYISYNYQLVSNLKINTMENQNYIGLKNLEVYIISRQLSTIASKIFCRMSFEDKKHIGDQFLRSVDSVGANIAEGYGRFHNMDKVRFYDNARASHFEAFDQWLERMYERERISH